MITVSGNKNNIFFYIQSDFYNCLSFNQNLLLLINFNKKMKFPNKSSTIWLLFFFLDIYMTRPQGLTFNASIYKTKTRNMFISVLKGK